MKDFAHERLKFRRLCLLEILYFIYPYNFKDQRIMNNRIYIVSNESPGMTHAYRVLSVLIGYSFWNPWYNFWLAETSFSFLKDMKKTYELNIKIQLFIFATRKSLLNRESILISIIFWWAFNSQHITECYQNQAQFFNFYFLFICLIINMSHRHK